MKKQYAVLGLGSFGLSVALTIEEMGGEVLAVDSSYEKIQEVADQVSYAVRADVSDPEALKMLGNRNLDVAIIAIGENLEASIMAVMVSKEMGIPYVVAKAKTDLQARILKKVGADAIVRPEHDMGARTAKNLMSAGFADWIELSEDFSLVETAIPESWVGKTLAELHVREEYDINVVGLIQDGEVQVTLNPYDPFPEKGVVILIGSNENLEFLNRRG